MTVWSRQVPLRCDIVAFWCRRRQEAERPQCSRSALCRESVIPRKRWILMSFSS